MGPLIPNRKRNERLYLFKISLSSYSNHNKTCVQFGKYNLDCIFDFDAGLDCTRIAILRNVGKNVKKFFKGSLNPILMLNNAKAFHWWSQVYDFLPNSFQGVGPHSSCHVFRFLSTGLPLIRKLNIPWLFRDFSLTFKQFSLTFY